MILKLYNFLALMVSFFLGGGGNKALFKVFQFFFPLPLFFYVTVLKALKGMQYLTHARQAHLHYIRNKHKNMYDKEL